MNIINTPKAINQKLRMTRFPFRWKITIPFIVLGVWLVVGGAIIVSRIVFENANERFNNQLLEGGKISAEWMVQEESTLLEGLRLLSYTSGVADALRAGDAEKLRDLTYTITLNEGLEAVEFLDPGGRLVFSMRHSENGPLEDYQFTRDGDDTLGRLDFVRSALQAQMDDRGDKYAGLVQHARAAFFYVSGPVYDDAGQRVGGIMVGLSLKTLIAHLRDQTFARITLYLPDGTPVGSSFSDSPVLDPAQANLILTNQFSASHTRAMRILETDFVELVNPWKARGQDLGLLGVTYARPVFVNPSIPTRVGMFIFVFAIFLLILSIGLIVANSITRPLVSLTQASHEVSKGNLQIQVPAPAANDELTDLTYTFNTMVDNLNEAHAEILDAYDSTLVGWSLALEMREKETASHGMRVTDLAVRLAQAMGMQDEELVHVRRGALLHDIGKIGIPDAILNKPGKLTEEEFAVMKRHPAYAWEFFSKIHYLRPALAIPYSHHEKWDGSGYPRGLIGEEIPLSARLFSVVDVWDALTNDRVYRKALPREEAIRIILEGRGTHFDPKVVDAFLPLVGEASVAGQVDPVIQALFRGIHVEQAP